MAGLTSLTEIYTKKGREFVEKLFDSYVTVNEKLDSNSFAFEKNSKGDISYFKKNADNPISIVDRTLMRLYELPIDHVNSLKADVREELPVNWRFGLEFFSDASESTYQEKPKNGLTLSYIQVKNAAGKTVRTIQSKEDLDRWADTLRVGRAPIIFQGVLNPSQRVKILEFLDSPAEKLEEKFKTESFVKYILYILDEGAKMSKRPTEGVVFRFGHTDEDVVLAKMVDPVFNDLAKAKAGEDEDAPSDIFYLTLINLMNYIDGLNFKKLKPSGDSLERRYINLMCEVFNGFIKENGDEYKDIDFFEPAYMKKKDFDINTDFIENDEAVKTIESYDSYKKLFKIMLASFRKKKKKPSSVFTSEVIRQFNGTIDKINNHISAGLKESTVPLFSEFVKEWLTEAQDVPASTTAQQGQQDKKQTFSVAGTDTTLKPVSDTSANLVDAPTGDAFVAFQDKISDLAGEATDADQKLRKKKRGKKVNIIVGRFQPFHVGHIKMAKDLKDANKLPCVVVAVHPGHNRSGNSPFSPSTMKVMLGNVAADSDGAIIDFRVVPSGFLGDVVDALRPDYEPILWGAGSDRIDDYRKQVELCHKDGNKLALADKFELMLTDSVASGTDVRTDITADKFGDFKRRTTGSVQGLWPLFRNDIQKAQREKEDADKLKSKSKKKIDI